MTERNIIVVGGGAAGAAATHALLSAGCRVTLLERDSRLGGRISSDVVDGHHVEMGAQDIVGYYRDTLRLAGELGLATHLRPVRHQVAFLRGGRPRVLASPGGLLGSAVLPQAAKRRLLSMVLRALRSWRTLDVHEMWLADDRDTVSVAEAFGGEGGRALVDRMLGPMMEALMHCPPERASAAILPFMIKTELQSGRLYRVDGGMQQLVERAVTGARVRLDCEVTRIEAADRGGYAVTVRGDVDPLLANGVICAVPGSMVLGLLSEPTPAEAAFFAQVSYSKVAMATCVLDRKVRSPGSIVMVPASESSGLTMIGVRSCQNNSDLPPDRDIVQLVPTSSAGPTLAENADDEQVYRALATQARAIDPEFDPDRGLRTRRIGRWSAAVPEFTVGYFRHLRRFQERDALRPGLAFAGDYLHGPFIEGAVTSGLRAADQMRSALG